MPLLSGFKAQLDWNFKFRKIVHYCQNLDILSFNSESNLFHFSHDSHVVLKLIQAPESRNSQLCVLDAHLQHIPSAIVGALMSTSTVRPKRNKHLEFFGVLLCDLVYLLKMVFFFKLALILLASSTIKESFIASQCGDAAIKTWCKKQKKFYRIAYTVSIYKIVKLN